MKKTIKLHPYVFLNGKGELQSLDANTTHLYGDGEVTQYGHIVVTLPSVQLEVEFPDDLRPQALAVLRKFRERLSAEHHATMTRLQFTENQLLALDAPDILDAEEELRRPQARDDDDDPFAFTARSKT